MDSSVETVNAAATAIVSADARVQQLTVPRRRWGARFSMYWCFGSQKHESRIGHAVLVPEPTLRGSNAPVSEHLNRPPASTLPFVVPPSSPASFPNSEPPSATQSPSGFLSFSALSANAYSPGPNSIFAIGPYANERQLVSPPVFSTFTTEPSTAPVTPPPESIQLTTPSSPEVPFAKLLTSSFSSSRKQSEAYEFQSYQLYPGSPIGNLISPSSVSGTSSPLPDRDTHASTGLYVPTFPVREPPKVLTGNELAARKQIPRGSLANGSLVDSDIAAAAALTLDNGIRPASDETIVNHRVSFELTAEDVTRCMEKKPALHNNGAPDLPRDERNPYLAEIIHDMPDELRPSSATSSTKEFKFSADTLDAEPDWWVQGKDTGAEAGPQKNWAFFPMIQPGVS